METLQQLKKVKNPHWDYTIVNCIKGVFLILYLVFVN